MNRAFLCQNKKIILGAGAAFFFLIIMIVLLNRIPSNGGRPDQLFNIPAYGYLSDLNQAMKENGKIDSLVHKILSYDELTIFTQYPEINSEMATLLFLWSGMDQETIQKYSSQQVIEVFIRRVYGLPKNEPIMGNPMLEKNPWGDLLNEFKVRLLMQGEGYKIYKGVAYYDNQKDAMIVEGELSKGFVDDFIDFLETLDTASRRKYLNNFLLFIRDTKGLRNLNSKEKELIKSLQVLK